MRSRSRRNAVLRVGAPGAKPRRLPPPSAKELARSVEAKARYQQEQAFQSKVDHACWNDFVRWFSQGKLDRVKEHLEIERFALGVARVLFVDFSSMLGKIIIDQLKFEGWQEQTGAAEGKIPKGPRRQKSFKKGFNTIPIADFAGLGAARSTFPKRIGWDGELGEDFAKTFASYEPIGSMAWGLHERIRVLREILHEIPRQPKLPEIDLMSERVKAELSSFGLWLGSTGAGRPRGRKDSPRSRRARRPEIVRQIQQVDALEQEARPSREHGSTSRAISRVAKESGEPVSRVKKRLYPNRKRQRKLPP